ncbi:oxygen-independent coproporphyrinogen III oxidase [Cupriavidus sp. 2SB]|uniref:oxygen-independent coproporphyrinogen III oxidase n=1 Tax=Cupriavidus sp. 2SB TaxID=2502199 RepID=UPI0010F75F3F|nr:oxygen-independent coproporphyrinogen III oxidase [Cupriavidus sp. 2SB]
MSAPTSASNSTSHSNSTAFDRRALADFRSLAGRIDGNGPRYTSYPTADRFHAEVGDAGYLRALDACRADAPAPLSLYLHIPFCENICYYCGCNKIITKDHSRSARYVDYLAREMAMVAAHLGERRGVMQSHWGGGTPTFLDPAEMRAVMAALHRHFELLPEGEHSIEIDPRRVTDDRMALLAELGFNRISLGVQDFDPEVQQAIHRVQSFEETRDVVLAARRLGFQSVSMDLIYGLPHQTTARFNATVDRTLELRPDRLSVYSYAHLPHVFKPQRRIDQNALPPAGEKLDILVSTIERLTAAGYVYIGMDHFALPGDDLAVAQREGRLQRNFQGYATHAGYDQLGLGVSAIGAVAGHYVQNARTTDDYYAALDAGRLPIVRGFETSAEDHLRRKIIGALMCNGTLDIAAIEAEHDIDFATKFADELAELDRLAVDNLVRRTPDRVDVTTLGRLLVRRVAMVFDQYLRQDARRPQPAPAANDAKAVPIQRYSRVV